MAGDSPIAPEFLLGNSELAALMRSMDWSTTSLGDTRHWPQSLRSATSICLGSGFPIAIYWGRDLALLYNDAWSPIPGNKHPWALGRPAHEVWPEIWDTIGPLFQHVISTGEATRSKDQLLPMRRHGYTEECYFDYTFTPIRGEDGKVEGIFNAVLETTYRVISERRTRTVQELAKNINMFRLEDEICRAAAAILERSREDVPFCMLYTLASGHFCAELAASAGIAPGGEEMFSSVSLHKEGRPAWPFDIILASGSPKLAVKVDSLAAFVEPGPWPEPCTEALIVPFGQAGGALSGFLVAGISPRRLLDQEYENFIESIATHVAVAIANARAYQEERKRAEALIEIDKAKTAFFSNISHEFRTPLTLILGPVEDILQQGTDIPPSSLQAAVETIHRNAVRLLRLVNNLLEFSRIEAGRIEATYRKIDIAALTVELAGSFRSVIEKAGLYFSVRCQPITAPVYVDPEMWEKIVLNLLSNAFKYTLSGGITVQLQQRERQVVLAVEDTGVGIPQHELPHMFERFHRVQNTTGRTHEGSGIGLSLVSELVGLHGGEISVQSRQGQGSIFTVTIPTGSDHLPSAQVLRAEEESLALSLHNNALMQEAAVLMSDSEEEAVSAGPDRPLVVSQRSRVLVVDDNTDMRNYMRRLLEREYEVEVAENGRVALQKIRQRRPELVISDIMMPVMDGVELLQTLRSTSDTVGIPVILLSARAGEEARVEGYNTGADDYLVKPFSAKELLARVRSHIRITQTRYQAEAQFRNLFMQAPALIAILKGRNGVCELFNPMFRKLWGERDVLNKPMREAWPELEGQGWFEMVEQVYDTGEPVSGHAYPAIADWKNNGNPTEAFFNFVYTPHYATENAIDGVMIFGFEVTEQVVAQRKAEENEDYFRKMADNVPVIIWVTRPDASCAYLNKQWYDYTGQRPDSGLGVEWLSAVHPDDVPHSTSVFLDAHTNHIPFSFVYRLKGRDGTYRWMLNTGSPRFGTHGEFQGCIGSVVDIHESRLAEEALRESEERFRTVADTAPVMIWMAGTDKLRYFFNRGWLNFTGRTMEQEMGYGWTEGIHPHDRQRCVDTYTSAFDERREFVLEYRLRRHDGEYRWISAHGVPRISPGGVFEGYIGSCMDIHEKKMISQELESRVQERTKDLWSANIALEKSNRELEQFAYIASHDLQEPLRKIQTFSELLGMNLHDVNASQKYIEKIAISAARMAVLIQDVLAYSRLSRADEQFVDIDLNSILENVKTDFELLITQKNAVVRHTSLPVVKGIPLQLHQLFSNLMSNALKFSGHHPVIEIACRTVADEETIRRYGLSSALEYTAIVFRDNGIGFEQQYAEQIFTIFQRLNNRASYSGTGIGLAICKKIVENHHGVITAQGELNKGATFTVYLPVL